jgi:hypothetical protein
MTSITGRTSDEKIEPLYCLPIMEQNKHSTSQGEVWLGEDGILFQRYVPCAELRLEDSLDELRVYQSSFCREGKRPILVDITKIKTVSKESRNIYASEEMGNIISAAALIVGNPVSRIIGNFYMGISKTKMPVRMFTSMHEAITWLRNYLS